jgi:hypothetical protein
LLYVLLGACTGERHYSCAAKDLGPEDYGPQPGFDPVANAPSEIEALDFSPGGRPIVVAAPGILSYDGDGVWTTMSTIHPTRMFHGGEDRALYAFAAGTIYRLDVTDWVSLANPPADDVIGSDFTGTFYALDAATHGVWTWRMGEPAWELLPGSNQPTAAVEVAVSRGGMVVRIGEDGAFVTTVLSTTMPVTSGDPSTISKRPSLLVAGTGDVFFATCADGGGGAYYKIESATQKSTLLRPPFGRYSVCRSIQQLVDGTLFVVTTDPAEPSANDSEFVLMPPKNDGPSTQLLVYLDGDYTYVMRDRQVTYGFRTGGKPGFIESNF